MNNINCSKETEKILKYNILSRFEFKNNETTEYLNLLKNDLNKICAGEIKFDVKNKDDVISIIPFLEIAVIEIKLNK